MGYYFSTRNNCPTVHHAADYWEDVDYWDYQFNFTCYDMAAKTASYLRNVCLAMRLVVDRVHELEAAEFSMGALLSTMLSANPEQVEYFVGLVDAYRQSIWNRPFDKDFYAALARGFMIWP